MDVLGGAQPLQDVLVAQVVAEEEDLVVHTEEAALRELEGEQKGGGGESDAERHSRQIGGGLKPDVKGDICHKV